MDDMRYLQPNFDPKQLKVAELRSVLVEYEIDYPSSAKKADLIALFNTHIKPNAHKYLNEYNQINPSGAGIINAAENSESEKDTKKSTRTKSPARKSTRRKKTEEPEELPSGSVPNSIPTTESLELPKRSTRGRSKSPARIAKEISSDESPKRRSRRITSTATKATLESSKLEATPETEDVKSESESSEEEEDEDNKGEFPEPKAKSDTTKIEATESKSSDSPFTKKNVFQSSSPIPVDKTVPQKRVLDEEVTAKSSTLSKKRVNAETPFKKIPKTSNIVYKEGFSSSPIHGINSPRNSERKPIISPGKKLLIESKGKKGSLFDLDDDEDNEEDGKKSTAEIDNFFNTKRKNESKVAKPSVAVDKKDKLKSKKLEKAFDQSQLKKEEEQEKIDARPFLKKEPSFLATSTQSPKPSIGTPKPVKTETEPEENTTNKRKSIMPPLSQLRMSSELASQLGVTIQGLAPPTPSRSTPAQQIFSSPRPNAFRKLDHSSLPTSQKVSEAESESAADSEEEDETESSQEIHSFAEYAKSIGHTLDDSEQSSSPEPKIDRSVLNKSTLKPSEAEESDEELSSEDEEDVESEENHANESSFNENDQQIITPELSEEDEDLNRLQKEMNDQNDNLNKKAADVLSQINSPRVSFFQILKFVSIWFSVLLFGLFAYWYREQKFLIGYCGSEIYQPTLTQTDELPKWLLTAGEMIDDKLKPSCIPCPAHARCFPNLELGCYDDFVEFKPWYSLNGLVPIKSVCIPDTRKAERVDLMIDYSLDLLRSRNANKNCGDSDDFEAGLSVKELHDLLLELKAPYITNEEFEELWEKSLTELEKEPEITIRFGDSDNDKSFGTDAYNTGEEDENKILRSSSLANLNLQCQLQRTIIGTMAKYRITMISLILIALSIKYGKYKYENYKIENERVNKLYFLIIQKLQKQLHFSKNDSTGLTKRYVGSNQLRDLLLSEENTTVKLRLWNKVSSKVEINSNIRSHLMEVHGEIMKVWEWITDVE